MRGSDGQAMCADKLTLRIRLRLIGALILIAGLTGASLVFMTASDAGNDADGYEIVGNHAYPISPRDSKSYIHDLEMYGGKAAVFADDFNRWFEGLWHGRQLAYTLAALAIGLALVCFLAANHLQEAESPKQSADTNE